MESEAEKLLMKITNSRDDDLSVKNRFLRHFAGFSPVNSCRKRAHIWDYF